MIEKVRFRQAQMFSPTPVVLVGCAHRELGKNVLTIAWTGVGCSDPPVVHVSIRPSRFSHRMIKESGCFTVNVPTREILRQVDLCGVVSGRDGDKFARAGLTPVDGAAVEAPIVAECPVNFECRFSQDRAARRSRYVHRRDRRAAGGRADRIERPRRFLESCRSSST